MLPIEMHGAVTNFRLDFGIRLGMGPVAMTPPTNLASDCSYMSRNMVQMDGGITYSLAVRTQVTCYKTCAADPFCRSLLPRTLLTSERGLQTTLVSRLKALSRVNTSFIVL